MTGFMEFLRDRLERGGFSTEDALACFLPLARQVTEAHGAGFVAPLDGVGELQVHGVHIGFTQAPRQPIKKPVAAARIERTTRAAVDIVGEARVTTDVDDGHADIVDLAIGDAAQEIIRPVYLANYQSWEHRAGCHDPLTDVFSLGMILASMTCGLDFSDRHALETFVAHRRNLFEITERLHPVVARVIGRMTEIHRSQRAADLDSLIRTLENYKDQPVDLETELAATKDFARWSTRDKRTVVLTKLRERLFEISRRNRLLHFRPTLQSINLTHASVPLSFDIKNIRPDQILTWGGAFARDVAACKQVSLNKYLNFAEVLYLPSQLERLVAETRRDRAEFGFAQLRLVVCFLNWANLKENPVEQYQSPLVLVPVELRKKKGIRDTYTLEPTTTEAEINPVVRHQFKQLYDLDLPESIDLAETTLDAFHAEMASKIASSEPAVTLAKIDRPRIQLIHEKARRKLDQYRRRARVAGRGVRTFLDMDYSYDPANYQPLGVKLFSALLRPTLTHLRRMVEESPRPHHYMAPERMTPEDMRPEDMTPDDGMAQPDGSMTESGADSPVAEKERQFYALQSGPEANAYDWAFDLCSVTVANFRYRRMSLVRDYESLLAADQPNAAFDAVFSLTPRPVGRELREPRPFAERFDVVPCDPTQAMAIAEASERKSYIIQGPPGTGKSQTITNLIADFVARGKRVLFVCEKRAAIDVVFARLKQRGLDELCCLIHDSQTDKKEFVMDLKRTYERFTSKPEKHVRPENAREQVVGDLRSCLEPLEKFDSVMQSAPPGVGLTVRQLIDRCVALRGEVPELDAVVKESLPKHAEWITSSTAIARFERLLSELGGDPVLARHPLRILSPQLADVERPLGMILPVASKAREALERTQAILEQSEIPRAQWALWSRARLLVNYAIRLADVTAAGQLSLLEGEGAAAQWLSEASKQSEAAQRAVAEAEDANKYWTSKLPEDETDVALEQATELERAKFAWLRPSWWRLRSVLNHGYGFHRHSIRPSWSRVLRQLKEEYRLRRALAKQLDSVAERLGVERAHVADFLRNVDELRQWLPAQPEWLRTVHSEVLRSPRGAVLLSNVQQAAGPLAEADAALGGLTNDASPFTFDELRESLRVMEQQPETVLRFLDALRELRGVPDAVRASLQRLPYTPRQIEAAIADHSLAEVFRSEPQVEKFTAPALLEHADRLGASYDRWLDLNAVEVRQRVQRKFLENLHLSESSAATLTPEQKEFKKRYGRGRRELEHEFGKQMRYKPIRDLATEETGQVVTDLKPVWLMSPLSVSDTLPLDSDRFDVVIFDEASQITLEEAVPALCRAPQSIVVGDEMQLPPTDFFSATRESEEDEEAMLVESDGELVTYDIDTASFLSHAAKMLPSTMLGWHYRSRSESLISFSNWAFYDGRLLTVPEEQLSSVAMQRIVAGTAEDGASGAAQTLRRAISFHSLPYAVYDRRRNCGEAEYIAEMVRALLGDPQRLTIGIVAFSEAQQDEIEQALARLGEEDKTFRELLEAEYEREIDGQFAGLLVKNLENIQGDERDIIILSVCYGRPPEGKMRMNFGPINKSGGEKRLNVAFSRARRHMALVSSIASAEITNDYNDGANCLKNYLRYAEASSVGDTATTQRILHGLSRWRDEEEEHEMPADVVSEELGRALQARGYQVERSVGQSHFRCDLAVYRDGDAQYQLGILIDTDAYYDQADLIERDLMRPRLLRAFGWRVTRVLAKDWYADPEEVLERVVSTMG